MDVITDRFNSMIAFKF